MYIYICIYMYMYIYVCVYIYIYISEWKSVQVLAEWQKKVFANCQEIHMRLRVTYGKETRPHGLQHTRPSCPWPTHIVYSNSCPLSWWCHPTISSSVVPYFSCLQPFPASGSFQMNQLFASGGQSIGVSASASVLSMNTQD